MNKIHNPSPGQSSVKASKVSMQTNPPILKFFGILFRHGLAHATNAHWLYCSRLILARSSNSVISSTPVSRVTCHVPAFLCSALLYSTLSSLRTRRPTLLPTPFHRFLQLPSLSLHLRTKYPLNKEKHIYICCPDQPPLRYLRSSSQQTSLDLLTATLAFVCTTRIIIHRDRDRQRSNGRNTQDIELCVGFPPSPSLLSSFLPHPSTSHLILSHPISSLLLGTRSEPIIAKYHETGNIPLPLLQTKVPTDGITNERTPTTHRHPTTLTLGWKQTSHHPPRPTHV